MVLCLIFFIADFLTASSSFLEILWAQKAQLDGGPRRILVCDAYQLTSWFSLNHAFFAGFLVPRIHLFF